ncbi:hypothetical protein C8Q76DRAFT_705810 [Earliella scabrosa]|nr:hypothetical protein C8Q76DRAFT_705810 [Earliella scabrosa]
MGISAPASTPWTTPLSPGTIPPPLLDLRNLSPLSPTSWGAILTQLGAMPPPTETMSPVPPSPMTGATQPGATSPQAGMLPAPTLVPSTLSTFKVTDTIERIMALLCRGNLQQLETCMTELVVDGWDNKMLRTPPTWPPWGRWSLGDSTLQQPLAFLRNVTEIYLEITKTEGNFTAYVDENPPQDPSFPRRVVLRCHFAMATSMASAAVGAEWDIFKIVYPTRTPCLTHLTLKINFSTVTQAMMETIFQSDLRELQTLEIQFDTEENQMRQLQHFDSPVYSRLATYPIRVDPESGFAHVEPVYRKRIQKLTFTNVPYCKAFLNEVTAYTRWRREVHAHPLQRLQIKLWGKAFSQTAETDDVEEFNTWAAGMRAESVWTTVEVGWL